MRIARKILLALTMADVFTVVDERANVPFRAIVSQDQTQKVRLCGWEIWVQFDQLSNSGFLHAQIPKAKKRQSSCQSFLCFWDPLT